MKKKKVNKKIIGKIAPVTFAVVLSMSAVPSFAGNINEENTVAVTQNYETEEIIRKDIGAKADDIIDEEALIAAEIEKNTDVYADSIELDKAVYIFFENGQIKAEKKNKTIKSSNLEKNGIIAGEGTITLGDGIFVLQGNYEGQIIIDAGKQKETVFVLNGATISNPSGEAVICKGTKSLIIVAADETENTIMSGYETEINEESSAATEDSTGGAVYSKADTIVTGRGILNISGFINNGLQVTKSLTIDAGTINIKAVNNGIRVKNTFKGKGGFTSIKSGNDGIKAEEIGSEAIEAVTDEITGKIIQEAQEATEDSGSICIEGGIYKIDCFSDGLESLLDTEINGGYISIASSGTYYTKGAYTKTHDKTFSGKGIKSGRNITFNGGTTVIKSYNDGIHCSTKFMLNDGTVSVYCGDDGLHSDREVEINGGTLNISNSCEGIEGNQITINGGDVSVTAGDDGMNAYGGSGFGSGGSKAGTPKETPNLIINGGKIYVRASGDGLDSNGNIIVNGGYTVVDGPTATMNGALDSGTENGGQLTITDGTVFAGGIAAMVENFNSKSLQPSVLITGISYKKNTSIIISDTEDNVIFEHVTKASGASIVFSSPDLEIDKTYKVKINEDEYEMTITGISTSARLKK